jgi:N-acetylmuramoyl-L-alanine amidase
MRKIDKIIIHCSATPPSMDIGADVIRKWHVEGNKWSDIGYHDIIKRDGSVEAGRDISIAGAHCKGQNAHSIGICLIGGVDDNGNPENNFTKKQFKSLRRLVRMYKAQYSVTIHGHREFSNKACPSFDVQEWLKKENV